MDFTQLSPSNGYKYVFIMVCVFSHWTEVFLCRQATASSVTKVLLEKIIPIWGTSLKLHSHLGTHLTGQVLQKPVLFPGFTTLSLCLPSLILWFN